MIGLCYYYAFFFMDFLYNFPLHMNRLSSVMMMSFLFSLVTGFGEFLSFLRECMRMVTPFSQSLLSL